MQEARRYSPGLLHLYFGFGVWLYFSASDVCAMKTSKKRGGVSALSIRQLERPPRVLARYTSLRATHILPPPAPCLLCVARSSRAQPQAESLHDAVIIMWGRGPALHRRAGGGGSNLPRLCLKFTARPGKKPRSPRPFLGVVPLLQPPTVHPAES